MGKGCRPVIERFAETHGAEQNQTKDGQVGKFTEDNEQESEGLVGGAGPVVDVIEDHYDLRDTEGVAGPDDRENHEDEGTKNTLGVCDGLWCVC
jgi:hypothetical protein